MSVVESFGKARVLCVGDVMIDRFVAGTIRRISPESPVPVLSYAGEQTFPGGAANVARNIVALGGGCTLLGVVGDDAQGRLLGEELGELGINAALVVARDRPTTEKTRFVAHGQHVLRVDREHSGPITIEVVTQLADLIARNIARHDVLVLSDYAKGVLVDDVIREAVRLAQANSVPVVVDPKSRNLARYAGASVITPNSRELEASTDIDPSTDNEAAAAAGYVALGQAQCDAILITRAEKGMTLVRQGEKPVHIASRAREVFDVVGAGDTVVATLALALGAGAGLEDAARIANVAAGVAVGRRGTSTVSQSDVIEALSRESDERIHAAKVIDRARISALAARWRSDGLRVGFTNGCFDILHLGHIELLRFSRRNCDRLIVGINTDESVKRLKGPNRPFNAERDRAEVLAALDMVDAVVSFGEDTPQTLIEQIAPDLLVKGADYEIRDIVGAEFVLARGGQVLRFELVDGRSSTKIIDRLREPD